MVRDIINLAQNNAMITTSNRERKQPDRYSNVEVFKKHRQIRRPRRTPKAVLSVADAGETEKKLRTYINKRGLKVVAKRTYKRRPKDEAESFNKDKN